MDLNQFSRLIIAALVQTCGGDRLRMWSVGFQLTVLHVCSLRVQGPAGAHADLWAMWQGGLCLHLQKVQEVLFHGVCQTVRHLMGAASTSAINNNHSGLSRSYSYNPESPSTLLQFGRTGTCVIQHPLHQCDWLGRIQDPQTVHCPHDQKYTYPAGKL